MSDTLGSYRRSIVARLASEGFSIVRRGCVAVVAFVSTLLIYRTVLNELDALTDADLRDLAIKPNDALSLAWDEARRRAKEGTMRLFV
jgi:uncharacterized protein YjiS (DUF1127 family)